ALPDQAEQDVLGADVVVAEAEGFPQRQLEHLLGPGRERDVALRAAVAPADQPLDVRADALQADPEPAQGDGADAVALAKEAEQEVLGPDVAVVEEAGLFLGQHHRVTGPVGEALEHDDSVATLSMPSL